MSRNNSTHYFGKYEMDVVCKCGHKRKIHYNGQNDMIEKMSWAENHLCKDCKEKQLKKENEHHYLPFWYYNTYLLTARNIVTGEYDPVKKEIELWIPKKKYDEYLAQKERRYFQIINSPVSNNVSSLIINVKGNTFMIKDQLKQLGAKWNQKFWCWSFYDISVKIEYDELHNAWIPPENNHQYYEIKRSLEQLGCIADYSKVNW